MCADHGVDKGDQEEEEEEKEEEKQGDAAAAIDSRGDLIADGSIPSLPRYRRAPISAGGLESPTRSAIWVPCEKGEAQEAIEDVRFGTRKGKVFFLFRFGLETLKAKRVNCFCKNSEDFTINTTSLIPDSSSRDRTALCLLLPLSFSVLWRTAFCVTERGVKRET